MDMTKLERELIETNDIKKVIKILKKIDFKNLSEGEIRSITNILDNKQVMKEYKPLKVFFKYMLNTTSLIFIILFAVIFLIFTISNITNGLGLLQALMEVMSLIGGNAITIDVTMLGFSALLSLGGFLIFGKEIIKRNSYIPSVQNLTIFNNLVKSLKEKSHSKGLSESKSVEEHLALRGKVKEEPKKIKPLPKNNLNKNNNGDILNFINTEFSKILDIEDSILSRNSFVNLANSLLYKIAKEDKATMESALNLVGEYCVMLAKKSGMLVKGLIYSLNSCYFQFIIRALENELDNIVDDADTIIKVVRLTSNKESYAEAAYMNRLLELYMDYNNKNRNKEQTRVRVS